jgi:hypothetical protein
MLQEETRFVRVVGWRHLPELSDISLIMSVVAVSARVDIQAIIYNYARRLKPRFYTHILVEGERWSLDDTGRLENKPLFRGRPINKPERGLETDASCCS